ncbi:MAG: DOPA 4,5-dioxygenase family protein [Alphaproteobacteria bacterium]|nr:DOPA 4,5-dioxygenase family protein [Alphaproteobacteria bacterium]MDP6621363.1 DOPA 4,5-dioxygenase family protein [Alphaproteobacteria bacterium]
MTASDDIHDYHVHVYFDAASRDPARALREGVEERFEVRMGRWHEKNVGPHPRWSYQIAFEADLFAEIVPWLMLNRQGLTLLLHPNTGDDVPDHTDHAVWMGEVLDLDLHALP